MKELLEQRFIEAIHTVSTDIQPEKLEAYLEEIRCLGCRAFNWQEEEDLVGYCCLNRAITLCEEIARLWGRSADIRAAVCLLRLYRAGIEKANHKTASAFAETMLAVILLMDMAANPAEGLSAGDILREVTGKLQTRLDEWEMTAEADALCRIYNNLEAI